jgi:hypothetical protein
MLLQHIGTLTEQIAILEKDPDLLRWTPS